MTELTNVVVHEHYQHRHGGIYFVEGVATHTETKERVVVYSHVFPFEEAMWVRPISMWTPDRFRKLNAAELGQLLGQDREAAKAAITKSKAASAKDKQAVGRGHRLQYDLPNGFDEDVLKDWYVKMRPAGSGPLGMMKMVCALIEEVAALKGISLEP